MPGVLIPEGFAGIKIVFALTGDTEPMIVTHGVDNPTSLDPDDIAATVRTSWNSTIDDSALSSAWTVMGVEAQLGTPTGTGGGVGADYSVSTVGTASAAAMPQNVAMLVHKRTGVGGRRGRGRFYLPGGYLQENAVSPAGAVDPALISSFNGLLEAYRDDLVSADLPMALLHSDLLVPPYQVTSLTVDGVVATQRKRLRK